VIPIQLKAPLIPTQVKSLHHFVGQAAQMQSTSTLPEVRKLLARSHNASS
jgi:hypothetical protein